MKHPGSAFRNQQHLAKYWKQLNYISEPDYKRSIMEYESLIKVLEGLKVNIDFLESSTPALPDSLYVRDASVVLDEGVIIVNMGKPERLSEPKEHLDYYGRHNYPILGTITGDATLEGGDIAWIDNNTLAVGRGYRSNDEGIRQLRMLLPSIQVISMHSPHFRGPADVFHLMSVFSPVNRSLAVVYSPLMSVVFREELIKRDYTFIEVPEDEFDSLGCNVLTVAPSVCIMVKGNPKTRRRLEKAGVEVVEFDGKEICLKGCGGPTCLTRPLLRELSK